MAAQYRDAAGNLTTVPLLDSTDSMLFAGYKDYVALLGVMRDYAQSAAELARLYGMRGRGAVQPGQKDDKTLAFELIGENNRELLLDTSLLNSLLPNAIPPESELDASGVRAALAVVLTSTAELDKAGLFLRSQVNVLGFDPDFLALISPLAVSNLWDSYDALRGWLDYPNTASSILGRASNAFADAYDDYDTYRGHADQVFSEMSANESTFALRYREICGYSPDEIPDPYPSPVPAGRFPSVNTNEQPSHYNNPRTGSELRQAHQSIEQSNAKSVSLTNNAWLLNTQLNLAHDRLDSSYSRSNSINAATKTYKDRIAEERDTITSWNQWQAGAQAVYDMISDESSQLAANDFLSHMGPGGRYCHGNRGCCQRCYPKQWRGEQGQCREELRPGRCRLRQEPGPGGYGSKHFPGRRGGPQH